MIYFILLCVCVGEKNVHMTVSSHEAQKTLHILELELGLVTVHSMWFWGNLCLERALNPLKHRAISTVLTDMFFTVLLIHIHKMAAISYIVTESHR